MTDAPESHKGSCLCGAVTLRIDGPLGGVCGCHCTMCRQQTGHFLATVNVAEADLTLSGKENVRWYASTERAQRGFCSNCGSVLFWQRPGSERIAIAVGCLEKPTGTRFDRHIFVADKGDYYEIEGETPQFAIHD